MKKIVTCDNCGIDFEKYFSLKQKPSKRNYCSNNCRREDKNSHVSEWTEERRLSYSEQMKGKNNPNYGNRWNEEQRKTYSENKIKYFKENPEVAYECGKSNRGIKFSQERIFAMHGHRTRESYQREVSEETKKLIGVKSSEKFTTEYKQNHRKTMEERGYWIPLDLIEPYDLYYKECDWVGNVLDYLSEEETNLLKENGVWNAKHNKKGFVRDHKLSRKEGWLLNVNPKIMRHPCNCSLLTHRENVQKGFVDRNLTEESSKEKLTILINDIKNFSGDWKEHKEVLIVIEETYYE